MFSLHPDPNLLLHRNPSSKDFGAMVKIHFEDGRFLVKTAETAVEREQVLEFRSLTLPGTGLPDRFDAWSDHLLVKDLREKRIVASFRLLSSDSGRSFVSGNQFQLGGLLATPGIKVELSRGGIENGYRTREVVALLWRGLLAYASCLNASALFGAASVPTTDPHAAALITHYLHQAGLWSDECPIPPAPGCQVNSPALPGPEWDEASVRLARKLLSPLFRIYLSTGARVQGGPARDAERETIDYLLVLPLRSVI